MGIPLRRRAEPPRVFRPHHDVIPDRVKVRLVIGDDVGAALRGHALISARSVPDTIRAAFDACRSGIASGLVDDDWPLLIEPGARTTIDSDLPRDLHARILESAESMPPASASDLRALVARRASRHQAALKRYLIEGLRLFETHPHLDPNFERIQALRRSLSVDP